MLTLWRNPTTGLAALGEEMERMVKDLAQPDPAAWSYGLAPGADVIETEADFRVVLDLPGQDPAAVKIDVENDTLTVQAERKQPALAKGETLHRTERAFGTFFRAFTLPKSVDAARVEARYEQGVLTVVLPKRDEAKPRSISIQVK
jgi:HSP20 family protein